MRYTKSAGRRPSRPFARAAVTRVPSADQYFDVAHVRLRYRDCGRGMAVIFSHGWTLDLDVWEPQAAELGREFRVIRYDRRGFGLSSGEPSVAEDRRDLLALIEHLALPQAAVVGASQGARAALGAALAAPQRIPALVLDAPPSLAVALDTAAEEQLPLSHYRELWRSGEDAAFRREWARHPFVTLRTADPGAHALLARVLARYPGRDLDAQPQTAEPPAAARTLTTLRQRVLIVNGEFDTASRRAAGEALDRALPGAEHVVIAHAGHLANLDNPPPTTLRSAASCNATPTQPLSLKMCRYPGQRAARVTSHLARGRIIAA